MKNSKQTEQTDIEECKAKIEALLKEYNCVVVSQDGYHGCLIEDKDTRETLTIR